MYIIEYNNVHICQKISSVDKGPSALLCPEAHNSAKIALNLIAGN